MVRRRARRRTVATVMACSLRWPGSLRGAPWLCVSASRRVCLFVEPDLRALWGASEDAGWGLTPRNSKSPEGGRLWAEGVAEPPRRGARKLEGVRAGNYILRRGEPNKKGRPRLGRPFPGRGTSRTG